MSEEALENYMKKVEPRLCKSCWIKNYCKYHSHGEICAAQAVLRRLLKAGKILAADVRKAFR